MRNLLGSSAILFLALTSCAPDAPKPAAAKPGAATGLTILTAANFEKEILLSQQPVLVDVDSPN